MSNRFINVTSPNGLSVFGLSAVGLSAIGLVLMAGSAAAMTLQEKTDAVLQACLASGKQQKLDGKLGVDGGITLTGPALHGTGDIALTREEWSGLIGGISKDMTQLQADQADKVRDCMAPVRERLMNKILDSD
jgi:hypothetical protein